MTENAVERLCGAAWSRSPLPLPRLLLGLVASAGCEGHGSAPWTEAEPFQLPAERPGLVEPALVWLPPRAGDPFRVQDARSGLAIEVTLEGMLASVPAEHADGIVRYRAAWAEGGDVVLRPTPSGLEDYVVLHRAPPDGEVRYRLEPSAEVAGLRLVSNVLELVDGAGTPRLRVASPWVEDATGGRLSAELGVEGCAFDVDPRAPWGRTPVPLDASSCTVVVRLPAELESYPAVLDPSWITTGNMTRWRQDHTATVLGDGRVLAVGGSVPDAQQSAELFDPATNTWAATDSMAQGRFWHTASLLPDGAVLVAGGDVTAGAGGTRQAEVYDPATGVWSVTTPMAEPRTRHAAAGLTDGRILVLGGSSATFPNVRRSAELYEPTSRTWWSAASMLAEGRVGHTTTTLGDGRVLVAGGYVEPAELYDPGSNSWSFTGAMTVAPLRWGHTAARLPDGRVLVSAGSDGSVMVASTQLYDPTNGAWTAAGDLAEPTDGHASCALPDGKVMVAGGTILRAEPPFEPAYTRAVELFDPSTGAWIPTTSLTFARTGVTASVLPSGAVLVAGGLCTDCLGHEASAELFLLELGDPCAEAGQCRSGQCVGRVCCSVGDCGAYACGPEGTCHESCTWAGDCIAGLMCDASGACVKADDAGAPGSSCRLGRGGGGRAMGPLGILLLLVGLAWRRRATPRFRARC
jgi:hypothetical protein